MDKISHRVQDQITTKLPPIEIADTGKRVIYIRHQAVLEFYKNVPDGPVSMAARATGLSPRRVEEIRFWLREQELIKVGVKPGKGQFTSITARGNQYMFDLDLHLKNIHESIRQGEVQKQAKEYVKGSDDEQERRMVLVSAGLDPDGIEATVEDADADEDYIRNVILDPYRERGDPRLIDTKKDTRLPYKPGIVTLNQFIREEIGTDGIKQMQALEPHERKREFASLRFTWEWNMATEEGADPAELDRLERECDERPDSNGIVCLKWYRGKYSQKKDSGVRV